MKTVIITGAAGNLGKAAVEVFLQKGWKVIAAVRKIPAGMPEHDRFFAEELDLGNEAAVHAFLEKIIREHGTIHAGLLLAGGFAMGSIRDTDMNMIRRQITLNFETAYGLGRALFDHFLSRQYGRLVFVGARSVPEPRTGKGALAYTLSKSLLFKLAEILNAEAKGKNIVSSVIVPSTIDTPDNRQSMPDADFSKWVSPDRIARLLCGLCSETGDPLRETVLKVYGNA